MNRFQTGWTGSNFNRFVPPPPPPAAATTASRVTCLHSSTTLTHIHNSGVIACLRAKSADVALEAARAAITGGICVVSNSILLMLLLFLLSI
ncbi:hypothetical protein Tco_0063638 [Tanacetum coccineum]